MFRKLLTKTIAVTVALAMAGFGLVGNPRTTQAQFNPEINYQGKLFDPVSGGPVADGDYDIVFRLYTASTGGSAIWTESRSGGNDIAITDGLFSVMLGDVSSLASVDWNQPLWLGVTVESDSEMTPRKPLGAVPAAFVADTLDGIDSEGFVRSDADDEIESGNTLTVTGTLDTNGDVSFADADIAFDGATTNFTTTGNFSINTNQFLVNKTSGETTIQNGLVLGTSVDLNSETITDFTGNGLSINSGALEVNQTQLSLNSIGGTLSLAKGGTGVSLSDPNIDRIMFWDDSAGNVTWLAASTGLSLSGTSLTVRPASETQTGISERATQAETNSGTDDSRYITPLKLRNWPGSNSITTLGTISAGTWQGNAIADGYIASASNWNTAFGWGNHATQGYLTSNQVITLSGDVIGSGSTAITTSLGANSVGDAEIDYSAVTLNDFTNDAGFINDLSGFDTDDLSEGPTNLYSQWTNETGGVAYAGSVGINTTSLTQSLNVNGNIDLLSDATIYVQNNSSTTFAITADGTTDTYFAINTSGTGDEVTVGLPGGDVLIGELGNAANLVFENGGEYINWAGTSGSTGYGIRDSGGTLQYKNSGGIWTDFSSGGGSTVWSLNGSDAYYDSGNVGIGTNSPESLLDLSGAAAQDGTSPNVLRINDENNNNTFTAGALLSSIDFSSDDSSFDGTRARIGMHSALIGGQSNDLSFWTYENGTGLSEAMRIYANSSIGIGTTATPVAQLEINTDMSSIGAAGLAVTDGTTGGYFAITEAANGASVNVPAAVFNSAGFANWGGYIQGGMPGAQDTAGASSDSGALVIDGRRSNNTALLNSNILNVRNNGQSVFLVNANGNVGIGNTDPASKLSVSSTISNSSSGTYYGSNLVTSVLPSGNQSSVFNIGSRSYVNIPGTAVNNVDRVYGQLSSVTADANVSYTTLSAGQAGLTINAGSTSNAYGYNAQIIAVNSGTSIADTYGIRSEIQTFGAGITNSYGLRTSSSSAIGGSITNDYGVYIGSMAGTNKWGIYQTDSAARNYLNGNLGLGVANPSYKLDITSTTGTQIQAIKTGTAGATGGAIAILGADDGGAMSANERLGGLVFQGATGSATSNFSNAAAIQAFSDAVWSTSSAPSRLVFQTMPAGGTLETQRLNTFTLDSLGNALLMEDSYLNWSTDSGTSGYGLRDNSGTMEFKDSSGTWTSFAGLSDERLKIIESRIDSISALERVNLLQGTRYSWKNAAEYGTQTELGFIAQEVQKVVPEVVRQSGDYLSVRYEQISVLNTEAIQELDIKINEESVKAAETKKLALQAKEAADKAANRGVMISKAGASLASVLDAFDAVIQNGRALFTKLFVREVSVVVDTDEDTPDPIGSFVFENGDTEITIENSFVTKDSKVMLTPRGLVSGFYLAEVRNGEFDVQIARVDDNDIIFDYWIIGVVVEDSLGSQTINSAESKHTTVNENGMVELKPYERPAEDQTEEIDNEDDGFKDDAAATSDSQETNTTEVVSQLPTDQEVGVQQADEIIEDTDETNVEEIEFLRG